MNKEENLTQNSKERKMLPSESTNEMVQMNISANDLRIESEEFKCYTEALHELTVAVSNQPDQFDGDCNRGSENDLYLDFTSDEDPQALFKESDWTIPACQDNISTVQKIDKRGMSKCVDHFPDVRHSSLSVMMKVQQEMIAIYKQLKAERESQQYWKRVMDERERSLKLQEEAFKKLEGIIHHCFVVVKKKHHKELSRLQDSNKTKTKENKRLKCSFDVIKKQNNNMRKQLDELNKQNEKLKSQSKKLRARFSNLQSKFEHCVKTCQKESENLKETIKPQINEKTAASGKPEGKGSLIHIQNKLLGLLLEWIVDGQLLSSVVQSKIGHLAQPLPPELLLNEKCAEALPLLADQLLHTPSESGLLLNLLRLIYFALKHLDKTTRHVSLYTTLRRIGEGVLRPPEWTNDNQPNRNFPLYQSPCPRTRILSNLIILRTLTKGDLLIQTFDRLQVDLTCEENQRFYIQCGGVGALLFMLRSDRVGFHRPIDILTQLTEQSRYIHLFLDACSCEEFFETISELLKSAQLELPYLEKLSILLQKLSSIRENRHLFQSSSIHLQLQDLQQKTDPAQTFLCLNITAILHNLS